MGDGKSLRGIQTNPSDEKANGDKAIQTKSDYALAYYKKGNALAELGKYDEAIQAYDQAIQLKPHYAIAEAHKVHALEEKYNEALQTYNQAIQINPDDALVYYNKGNTLEDLRKYEEAIQAFDDAIQLTDLHACAYYKKGHAMQKLEKYSEAIEAYDKVIQLKDGHACAYYNKGNAWRELGKYEEAVQAYDEAIQLKPDYAEAYNSKGRALQMWGKYDEAIQAYNKAIQIKFDYADAYYSKGNVLIIIRKYEDAIKAYDQAIQLQPHDSEFYYNRGLAFQKLGKYHEAIQNYEQAIQIKPDDAEFYYNKGLAFQKLGKYHEAIQAYDQAIQIRPDHVNAYCNKGDTLNWLGKYAEAVQALDNSLKLQPNNPIVCSNKGEILDRIGEYQEAIELFSRAIKNDTNEPLYYCNRGITYSKLKQWVQALQDFNKSQELLNQGKKSEFGCINTGEENNYLQNIHKYKQELLEEIMQGEKEIVLINRVIEDCSKTKVVPHYIINEMTDLRNFQDRLAKKTINIVKPENFTPSFTEKLTQEYGIRDQLLVKFWKMLLKLNWELEKLKDDRHFLMSIYYDQARYENWLDSLGNPNVCDYANTLYWMQFNYVSAHCSLNTGLISGNLDSQKSKNKFVKWFERITHFGAKGASGIPYVGGIIALVESMIGEAYACILRRNLQNKVNIITRIVIKHVKTLEDLSYQIQKATMEITEHYKQKIPGSATTQSLTQQTYWIIKAINWVSDYIKKIKNTIAMVTELHDTEAKKLAIGHVTLVLTYIYANDAKLNPDLEFSKQLAEIVKHEQLEEILKRIGERT